MEKIGLALGGGGAKGFAHIPVLEAFDELGLKPAHITGTSVGAIIGALYASGHSGQSIAEMLVPPSFSLKDLLLNKDSYKLLALLDPHISIKPKGLLKGEKFLQFLYDQMNALQFNELNIPFQAVATDFWDRSQVVFSSGELLPAIRASMAIPYIFSPVILDGRVLVDGGLVNNVPHDLLPDDCDIIVAVNIMGRRSVPPDKPPSPLEAIAHSYQVMMETIVQQRRKNNPPDIYLRSPLMNIEMLDFHKARSIYEQGLPIKETFKREIDKLLSPPTPPQPFWKRWQK